MKKTKTKILDELFNSLDEIDCPCLIEGCTEQVEWGTICGHCLKPSFGLCRKHYLELSHELKILKGKKK
jgi:hypothetical protein